MSCAGSDSHMSTATEARDQNTSHNGSESSKEPFPKYIDPMTVIDRGSPTHQRAQSLSIPQRPSEEKGMVSSQVQKVPSPVTKPAAKVDARDDGTPQDSDQRGPPDHSAVCINVNLANATRLHCVYQLCPCPRCRSASRSIFIGPLKNNFGSWDTAQQAIWSYFSRFGRVELTFRKFPMNKGMAVLVRFANEMAAVAAVKAAGDEKRMELPLLGEVAVDHAHFSRHFRPKDPGVRAQGPIVQAPKPRVKATGKVLVGAPSSSYQGHVVPSGVVSSLASRPFTDRSQLATRSSKKVKGVAQALQDTEAVDRNAQNVSHAVVRFPKKQKGANRRVPSMWMQGSEAGPHNVVEKHEDNEMDFQTVIRREPQQGFRLPSSWFGRSMGEGVSELPHEDFASAAGPSSVRKQAKGPPKLPVAARALDDPFTDKKATSPPLTMKKGGLGIKGRGQDSKGSDFHASSKSVVGAIHLPRVRPGRRVAPLPELSSHVQAHNAYTTIAQAEHVPPSTEPSAFHRPEQSLNVKPAIVTSSHKPVVVSSNLAQNPVIAPSAVTMEPGRHAAAAAAERSRHTTTPADGVPPSLGIGDPRNRRRLDPAAAEFVPRGQYMPAQQAHHLVAAAPVAFHRATGSFHPAPGAVLPAVGTFRPVAQTSAGADGVVYGHIYGYGWGYGWLAATTEEGA